MTEKELASQLEPLHEAAKAGREMQVRVHMQAVDEAIAGEHLSSFKGFSRIAIVKGLRFYGEFKWLWGVHQKSHAVVSLQRALEALKPDADRKVDPDGNVRKGF